MGEKITDKMKPFDPPSLETHQLSLFKHALVVVALLRYAGFLSAVG